MLEVALKLAESPCGPLGMESPKRATLALFGRPELPLVKGVGDGAFGLPREHEAKHLVRQGAAFRALCHRNRRGTPASPARQRCAHGASKGA